MTTIILTSTVNVNPNKSWVYQSNKNERIEIYLKSILQWLTKTNFNVILVENSGYSFEELDLEKKIYQDRFDIITFNENEINENTYLNLSKGNSELFSINYAFRNSKLINEKTNFIIKITARYFIEELEDFLKEYDLNNYDSLSQSDRRRCEMVGSHIKNFKFIFNDNIYDDKNNGHVEGTYLERLNLLNNILVCKNFEIEETQRGGVNKKYFDI